MSPTRRPPACLTCAHWLDGAGWGYCHPHATHTRHDDACDDYADEGETCRSCRWMRPDPDWGGGYCKNPMRYPWRDVHPRHTCALYAPTPGAP